MPQLSTNQHFRQVQTLGFCYLCGRPLGLDEARNRDHNPPKTVFLPEDRDPALWLPTHTACNGGESLADEKIGQLIALRYGKVPQDPKNRRLEFAIGDGLAAVVNCDVDGAVWRWVRGFHAALYREPLPVSTRGRLATPFARAPLDEGPLGVEPLSADHRHCVHVIKTNRALRNLDGLTSNGGKLTYECVWGQAKADGPWLCVFALDLYDWKDLGATDRFPARGCAGFYALPSGERPDAATVEKASSLILPNRDPLDPFGP